MTPEVVLGPPGTGKTTTLLAAVEAELSGGTPPDKIGYVSFTRRAATEAVERACSKFGLTSKQFPYFRTIHSLCFRQLGLRSEDVLQGARMSEFARYAGVRITGRWSDDGTFTGQDVGDRLIFMIGLARIRQVHLREQYNAGDDGLSWDLVQATATRLRAFKDAHGLIDYTDMLENFLLEGVAPLLDVLFVDEAQDLSHLQWAVVAALSRGCRRVVIAGDDDQAIFRWAGADVDHLIRMEGEVRVLGQSWRVPPVIQGVANRIIGNVRNRRPKDWAARAGEDGGVSRVHGFQQADCGGEDVLVLARNTYVLVAAEPWLRRQGIVYEVDGHPSIRASLLAAITSWEHLRHGDRVPVGAARAVYDLMSSGKGVARGHKKLPAFPDDEAEVSLLDLRERGGLLTDGVWYDALDRVPAVELSYILAARKRGERLRERPRVRLSTIHGSKGGEAAHVVLLKEMARRTYREMELSPEDEARVWYVGVTRARERLTIVEAETAQSCPWI